MPGVQRSTTGTYLKVVAGNIVEEVEEGTEGARKRAWEAAGKKGVKFELVYSAWEGVIENIEIKEMEFGKICNIKFADAIISLNTESRYFQDFACKVFNADLSKSVIFHPYDIEDDKGHKTGVSFQQNGKKLSNYFYDFKKKERLHDFPAPDETQTVKKGYWKFYFASVAEFLIEKIQELKFQPSLEPKEELKWPLDDFAEDVGPTPDDLPF